MLSTQNENSEHPSSDYGERLVERIKDLVDGNGATASDLSVLNMQQADRRVGVRMDIDLDWDCESSRQAGVVRPSESRWFPNEAALKAAIEGDWSSVAVQTDVVAAMVRSIQRDPVYAFRSLSETFKVRDLPGQYHCHQSCNACSGQGSSRCTNRSCSGGRTRCPTCTDGKTVCHACTGDGATYQHLRDPRTGQVSTERRPCLTCEGSGRSGRCYDCGGRRRLNCTVCRGTGRLSCTECNSSGSFTLIYRAWLEGRAKRLWDFGRGHPKVFVDALKNMSAQEFPGRHADAALRSVTPRSGGVTVVLDCDVQHWRAQMRCGSTSFSVDAVGREMHLLMPPFLDELLAPIWNRIRNSHASAPKDAITAAREARLTRRILDRVCKGDAGVLAVAEAVGGAISAERVDRLFQCLAKAYDRLGQKAIRRTWIVGGAIAAALSAAAAIHHVPSRIMNTLGVMRWEALEGASPVIQNAMGRAAEGTSLAVITLVPVLMLSLLAPRIGRRIVRNIVGSDARRLPRQGPWPYVTAAAILGAYILVRQTVG